MPAAHVVADGDCFHPDGNEQRRGEARYRTTDQHAGRDRSRQEQNEHRGQDPSAAVVDKAMWRTVRKANGSASTSFLPPSAAAQVGATGEVFGLTISP
jgi:hypothetical protein